MTPAPFHYYLRVRYHECDAQLVVFNARYGDYVDVATMEFFRALGFADEVASNEFDMQLVKQTTTWKAPARNYDVLEIEIAAKTLGNTSFTLQANFRIAGTAAIICHVETVYVRVDHATLIKRPIGEDLRTALTRGTPDARIDHAGYLTQATTELTNR
jgi:acyl-CoA thioester hydrolase